MRRRDFLVGSAATLLAPYARAAEPSTVLVLVELNGGPDTLQMVIPKVGAYRALRPRLAVGWDQTVALGPGVQLNRQLEALLPAWQAGQLAVVQGVGYAPANRSHFRSIEIWNQAGEALHEDAWLTRALGAQAGLVLGGEPGPLGGANARSLVIPRMDRFLAQARHLDATPADSSSPALAHVLAVRSRVDAAADALEKRLAGTPRPKTEFPRGGLGQQLALAARVIAARAPFRVIKLRQGGYDTHAAQPGKLNRLMKELAGGLAALRLALLDSGDWDRSLVLTYAEFGRRAAENGSRGTDHGTAATHLALGGKVRGGLHGQMPSLTDLPGGDLRHHVDFRALYHAATRHLGLPASELATWNTLSII